MKHTLLILLLLPALALAETRTVTKDKDTQNLTSGFNVPSGVTVTATGTGVLRANAAVPGSPLDSAFGHVSQLWDPVSAFSMVEVSDGNLIFTDAVNEVTFQGGGASFFRSGLFGHTVSFGGNFSTSGSGAVTLTITGATNLTLPTSGTLATTSYVQGEIDSLHDVVTDQINDAKATVNRLWDSVSGFSIVEVSDGSLTFTDAFNEVAFQGGGASFFRSGLFGHAVSFGGNFSTSGSGAVTLTITGATNLTLPTSGTLATTAQLATKLSLSGGELTGIVNLGTGSRIDFNGADFIDGYGSINLKGNGICTSGGDQIIEADEGAFIVGVANIYYGGIPLFGPGTFLERSTNQTVGSIDLGAAEGNFVTISGTGTVTTLGEVPSGVSFTLYIQNNVTFQAGDLLLPGGENFYAVSGDILTFRSTGGGGEWILTSFARAASPVTATRIPASAISVSDGVAVNVINLSIPRGSWNIVPVVTTEYSGAAVNGSVAALTTTSATIPSDVTAIYAGIKQDGGDDSSNTQVLPTRRVNLSTQTTYYLVTRSWFSSGSAVAYGAIYATPAP